MAILVSGVVIILMLYRATADYEGSAILSLGGVGWAILISAFACLTISIALTIYAHFVRASVHGRESHAADTETLPTDADALDEADTGFDMSRLPDDERRICEIIADAGGEILQMRLVSLGVFSKSKVTRLLDKLEDRELIKRERHGMTNMVKLVRRP